MKFKSFILLLLLISVNYSQTSTKQLQSKIDKLFKNSFFESSMAGVDIFDLTHRKILFQKNNNLLFRPASNMKILTSAAGLLFLGEDYQFKTSLYYEGEIIDSVLYGHLYVVGGCDPDFTSDDLEKFTQSLQDLGVKKVTGNIYGDISMTDSLFWGQGWMWDDDPSTDAPYMSALNINDNAVTIVGEYDNQNNKYVFSSIPETKYIEIVQGKNSTGNESNSRFRIDRDWINRMNKFLVEGSLSNRGYGKRNTYSEKFNVYRPENYFLTLFRESLEKNGIKFSGDLKFKAVDASTKPIFVFSRSYDSVIVNLNKTSDNLSAEMTLLAVAEKYFGKPASARNGLKMIDSLIIICGLNPKDYRLVDGSGVSHYNLVSAELLLSVLKYFYDKTPKLFKILYDSFPVAGIDGTLENRMQSTRAANNVHAKTGTISGVSSLSGYVTSKKGNMIAFSILVQNYVGNSRSARNFIDDVCEVLANSIL